MKIRGMQKWIFIGIFIVAIITGAVIYTQTSSHEYGDGVEVTWELLGQLDYVSGKATSELSALDNQKVKVPGFMVPLEDAQNSVTEFLLVPSPQACIHVPPPPPNQMLFVQMKKAADIAFGPIWVYGTLKLVSKRHMYGEASFEIIGDSIEPYK